MLLTSCSTIQTQKFTLNTQTKYKRSFKICKKLIDLNNKELMFIAENTKNHNKNIQQAVYSIKKAYLEFKISKTNLFPEIDLNFSPSENISKNKNSQTTKSKKYSLGLSTQYEIDLWGRISSGIKISQLGTLKTKEAYNTLKITTVSNALSEWIEITALNKKIDIDKKKIKIQKTVVLLNKNRLKTAQINVPQLANSIKKLKSLKIALSKHIQQKDIHKQKLAFLMGMDNVAKLNIKTSNLPKFYLKKDIKIPVKFLLKRPDVKNAELSIASKIYSYKAQKADMFPKLTLSSNITYTSNTLSHIFDNWAFSLIANVFYPLIDYNKKTLRTKEAKIEIKNAVLEYKQTLLNAAMELENTLSSLNYAYSRIKNTKEKLKLQQIIYAQNRSLYASLQKSLIETLSSKIDMLDLESDLIDAESEYILNAIGLCKVLGVDISNFIGEENGKRIYKNR